MTRALSRVPAGHILFWQEVSYARFSKFRFARVQLISAHHREIFQERFGSGSQQDKIDMTFQDDPITIHWRLHLRSARWEVYQALSTDTGRASFWAESAVEREGKIHFVFPNKLTWEARILEAIPQVKYVVRYIGNSVAAFVLDEDGRGGTDLTLTDTGVPAEDRTEVIAGWVSVLMTLKAAVDFGVDLRTHDPGRHWDQGYVEN